LFAVGTAVKEETQTPLAGVHTGHDNKDNQACLATGVREETVQEKKPTAKAGGENGEAEDDLRRMLALAKFLS
jgi:hypothetical protein